MTTTTMAIAVCLSMFIVRTWATTASICDKYLYTFTFAHTHTIPVRIGRAKLELDEILQHINSLRILCFGSRRKWNGIRVHVHTSLYARSLILYLYLSLSHPISRRRIDLRHWIGMSVCHTRERRWEEAVGVWLPCTNHSIRKWVAVYSAFVGHNVFARNLCSHIWIVLVCLARSKRTTENAIMSRIFLFYFFQRQSNRNGDDDNERQI